ncbi:hypothetical protein [Enterococcus sp. CSURQ0835]|uniref:hypothetical protein n=1 Tax=Enterococcus sp. CSURQ0835 TaxID=2681394 RepID=UPI00135A8C52|nr:hypothetical protein [Enterococcus sp. CSURQ0835]
MNTITRQQFPFLFFILPYVQLSLIIDYYFHSVIGIVFSLLVAFAFGFYARRTHQLMILFFGNLFNVILSYLLTFLFLSERLTFFYQPFSPFLIVTLLTLLFILTQLIGCFWGSFFTRRYIKLIKKKPTR